MGSPPKNSRNKDNLPLREVGGIESPGPWEMGQEGVSSSAAIGADETIYVGANEGKLYVFAPDGAVRWHFSTAGSGIVSSPAVGAACMPWAGREKMETRRRPPSSPPPKDATVSERMRCKLKLPENREQHRKREQPVEPVFGQIKEARGLWHFLLRRLDKVSALWQLEPVAHNL
jgi:hypothetical protein